jgi:O-6-methylguanine DNA methyltransferase
VSGYGYDIISTPLGKITVVFSDKGVCRIVIGKQSPTVPTPVQAPVAHVISGKTPLIVNRKELVPEWRWQLEAYFLGKPVVFEIPLDISEKSSFRKKTWETLCRIPYGETRPYCWVAEQIGMPRASRAVGQANAANPVPIIIPCHRVVRSDGSLGGFSSGVHVKRQLLELEGILKITPGVSCREARKSANRY